MIEPVALIFKLNNSLIARALEGLSEDDVWWQPAALDGRDSGNTIAWLVGCAGWAIQVIWRL